jgi:putative ABC transport system permease protein
VGEEGSAPEVVFGGTVNSSFFDVLGIEPELGRFWTVDEEGEGRELRVVIGYGLWQRRLGGDPEALNRPILVNGNPVTVIGVLPRDFETPGLEGGSFGAPEIWRTVATPPAFRSGRSWSGIGRLEDGMTLAGAQQRVDAATRALEQEFPEDNLGWGIALVPLREQLIGDADRVIALLMSAVALVLLIACANVASLLLVRAIEKRRELDLRLALGASRSTLVATTLLESGVLSLSGAALGIALAYLGVRASGPVLEQFLPRTEALSIDPTVTAFAVATAILTGLLFGIVPAADAWRRSSGGSRVASGARGASAGVEGVRLRRALVTAEVALSVVLLVGAGVLVRTLDALYDVDLGIQREGVLAAGLHSSAFTNLAPEEADALYTRLLDQLRALPGVRSAGAINILPLSGGFSCDGVTRDDLPPPSPSDEQCAEIRAILPGALEAFGVTPLDGRLTTEADHRTGAQRVVLVSREMADAFWPGDTPIGKSVTIHEASWQVVGVVSDVRHFGPAGLTRPQAYIPAQQDPWGGVLYGLNLVIAGSGDAHAFAPAVRRVVAQADAKIAITSMRSVDDLLATSVAAPRFRGALLGAFAALAVLLAMVGLGGVIAYSVRQRRREIGVRIALGATPRAISSMVLGEAGRLILAGGMVGVLGAVLAAGALESMVFGVNVRDPWTVAAAPVLIALVGFAVSWLPARRAARTDPLRGLAAD